MKILIAEKDFSQKAIAFLSKHGKVTDFGSRATFFKNLPDAEAVITGLEVKLHKSTLDKAKKLKLIGSRTTQLRYLDLDECKRRGIKVVNIKADAPALQKTPSTAEEAMALILTLLRRLPWAFESIKRGEWDRKKYGGHELAEKTIGLIGFGRLGRMVSKYSRAFDMKVIATDPYVDSATMKEFGVDKVSLNELLKTADIVSLHSIYNDETFGMLKFEHFAMMKSEAVFINTARGEITEEAGLLRALKEKKIAGAAVDTLANESPDGAHLTKNPLVEYARKHDNLIIVPHLGGATQEATERTQLYISELVINEIKKRK